MTRDGGAFNRGFPDGMMLRPGSPGCGPGSEVLCMHRWSAVAVVAAGLGAAIVVAAVLAARRRPAPPASWSRSRPAKASSTGRSSPSPGAA